MPLDTPLGRNPVEVWSHFLPGGAVRTTSRRPTQTQIGDLPLLGDNDENRHPRGSSRSSHQQTSAPSGEGPRELQSQQAPPLASSLLAKVVFACLAAKDDVRLADLHPHGALLRAGKNTTLLWLEWREDRAEDLLEHLQGIMKQATGGPLILGLVGGTAGTQESFKKARPGLTQVRVGQIHIADDGNLWSRDTKGFEKALLGLGGRPGPSESTWANVIAQSSKGMEAELEGQAEAMDFSSRIEARKPVVTWGLAAVILAVFGLEFLFGGTESAPVLIRMGALSPERVRDGEIWRLLSCTFLHSGPLHVAFNTYVLVLLGSFLEKVLGSWRFLLLYGFSCLAGSLASFAFLEGFSVGASGGLWGLLGAQAVLAYRPVGLLPRMMLPGARRAAMINLGLNLFNSFRPNVDMWAHFGGGAMGGALLVTGLLTRGLPRLGESPSVNDSTTSPPEPVQAEIPSSGLLKISGAATAVILVGCLAIALLLGRPWDLKHPVELSRASISDLGFSLALPEGISLSPAEEEDRIIVHVGDLLSDPGAAILEVFPMELSDTQTIAREKEGLAQILGKSQVGRKAIAGPENTTLAGVPAITVTYRYENDLEEEVAFAYHPTALIKIDALRWPATAKAVPQGYAAQVLDSLEWLP